MFNLFRFKQEIEQVIRVKLTDKLKLLRFKPALIHDKRVESIYTIKSDKNRTIRLFVYNL